MNFYCLDERQVWYQAALDAARNHGYEGKRIFRGNEVNGSGGIGFIRPHVDPPVLERNQEDYWQMAARVNMIQDQTQVELYEDKSGQFEKWHDWMPKTWRFTDKDEAWSFVHNDAQYPLVSKADVGASSMNVRIIHDRVAACQHIENLFGDGVAAQISCEVPMGLQKGYALLQEFIPHSITWRVNAIGDARAAFMRYCYSDRPVAQTGNVDPVMEMTPEIESLLEYSNRFFKEAGTKWCAIDVLSADGEWKLLETSLAWPWPSPGMCNEAPIFGTKRKWIGMFEAMFDQYQEGAWAV